MTIAAGFFCSDGSVLSTDTLMTASPSKIHQSKLVHFEFPGGKIGFAYAGNVAAALSAINKVKKRLTSRKRSNPFDEVERTLEREYKRQVLNHPDHKEDPDLDYWFLFALWLPKDRVRLYGTSGISIYPIDSWDAIGIGADLMRFIMQQGNPHGTASQAIALSSYALSSIKDCVDGCGGMSLHLVVSNEGEVGLVTSISEGPPKGLQEFAKEFDFMVRNALMQMTNADASTQDVKRYLDESIVPRLLTVHDRWSASLAKREAQFAALNPQFSAVQVKQAVRRLSIGLSPLPPP